MADLTHLSTTAGLPGGDYGSFVKGGGAHDPGAITELSGGGWPGGLYGSFEGKQGSSGHNPGALTELACHGGLPGGIYGDFGGKEPGVVPPTPEIDVPSGLPPGRVRRKRVDDIDEEALFILTATRLH